MSERYPRVPERSTVLPIRAQRHAAVLGFLDSRCGRVSFTPATFRELRADRGLTYGATMAALEQLVDAGRVRVRRLVGDQMHVELVAAAGSVDRSH